MIAAIAVLGVACQSQNDQRNSSATRHEFKVTRFRPPTETYPLGRIGPGERTEVAFHLHNATKFPVVLGPIQTSCECLQVSLDTPRIVPGQTIVGTVELDFRKDPTFTGGLLLTAVQNVRAAASRIACANNLKQIGLACHLHHDHNNRLPAAYEPDTAPNPGLTWPVRILPFLEQENLFARSLAASRLENEGFRNPPHEGLTTVVKVYTCPTDGRLQAPITDDRGFTAAYGSYVGVFGNGSGNTPDERANGTLRPMSGVRLAEITDGTSNTLLIGEKPPWGKYLSGNWYTMWAPDTVTDSGITSHPIVWPLFASSYGCARPIGFGPGRIDNFCDTLHFWSLHPGGAHFAFADGSVRFLRYSAKDVMPALATRAGGEVVAIPD